MVIARRKTQNVSLLDIMKSSHQENSIVFSQGVQRV